ncbi:MAG: ribonuclease H-like domain-containing protein [Candidatus Zixiibacteriota bacterium]
MELEDRLKRLTGYNLTRGGDESVPEEKDRILELLDGATTDNRFGEFVLVRKRFALHGLGPTAGAAQSFGVRGEFLSRICSSRKSATNRASRTPCRLEEAAFIDCETTGLAGGTGTYAFLVGVGYLSGDDFWVEQYFMQDFHQERAILSAVAERLNGFKSLVSFNGRCFDVPLLQNRFVINRLDFDSANWDHLDLLFPSRRMWKRRIGECSLANLEHQVLGVQREIDVSSYLIPQIYFDYLRTGEADSLVPVFHHNAQDIFSLLRLSLLIDQTLEDHTLTDIRCAEDLFSLSRIHYDLGDYQSSERCLRQTLSEELPPEWRQLIHVSLGSVYKKMGLMEKAQEAWHEIVDGGFPFSISACEELAKYYEHRRREYHRALFFVEKAMSHMNADRQHIDNAMSRHGSARHAGIERWEYRKSRLERKIEKLQAMPKPAE